MLVTAAGLCDRKGQPRHLQCVACWRWSMPPMTRPTIVKLARKPLHACGCDRPMRPAGPDQAPAVCCILGIVHAAYDKIRYSLAGQDTQPSPERPGLESRWRNSCHRNGRILGHHPSDPGSSPGGGTHATARVGVRGGPVALLVGPGELCSSPTHGSHHAVMRSGRHGRGVLPRGCVIPCAETAACL